MVRQGDTTFQDEASITPIPFVGTFTRDQTLATGTQSVTGLGFRPSVIQGFANVDVSATAISIGYSNATTDICTTWNGTTGWSYLDFADGIFSTQNGPSNYQRGTIQSMDADGFTVSWTKVGSPSGTATQGFIAHK